MLQILGDGADFALENTPLDSVEISDDGNNVGFSDCPIGTCAAGSDLDDLEKMADKLECRAEDIKCAAEDAKAILNDIEPKVTTLLEKLNEIDINED